MMDDECGLRVAGGREERRRGREWAREDDETITCRNSPKTGAVTRIKCTHNISCRIIYIPYIDIDIFSPEYSIFYPLYPYEYFRWLVPARPVSQSGRRPTRPATTHRRRLSPPELGGISNSEPTLTCIGSWRRRQVRLRLLLLPPAATPAAITAHPIPSHHIPLTTSLTSRPDMRIPSQSNSDAVHLAACFNGAPHQRCVRYCSGQHGHGVSQVGAASSPEWRAATPGPR